MIDNRDDDDDWFPGEFVITEYHIALAAMVVFALGFLLGCAIGAS